MSLKLVPRGQINNTPASVQIMAWHRPGDKPLSEPMMVRLVMHICITQPRWVNSDQGCNKQITLKNELCSLLSTHIFTPQPSGLEGYCRHGPGGRAGGRSGGRAGGCQTCWTHISVTAWWIFSVRSSMELSRPVVVHCHAHLPICPIWACPWAKNLSNLPQIGSRLCGSHISETAGWIYPI